MCVQNFPLSSYLPLMFDQPPVFLSHSLLNLDFCFFNTLKYLTYLTLLMKAWHSLMVSLSKTHANLLIHLSLLIQLMLTVLLMHLILSLNNCLSHFPQTWWSHVVFHFKSLSGLIEYSVLCNLHDVYFMILDTQTEWEFFITYSLC